MTRARASSGRSCRLRRQLPALVAAPVLALALSGCLSNGYAYYSRHNPDNTELYFKLPSKWTTYGASQVIEAQNGKLSQSQLSQIEQGQWEMEFAGARGVGLKQIGNLSARHPQGEAIARQLSSTARDSLSLSAMRATFLGQDPLTATGLPVTVLSYSEFTGSGGLRGNKMVVDVNQSGLVSTLGQVVVVDPQTNWIFGIAVSCRASCWGPNQGLITQVLNSWSVKELGR